MKYTSHFLFICLSGKQFKTYKHCYHISKPSEDNFLTYRRFVYLRLRNIFKNVVNYVYYQLVSVKKFDSEVNYIYFPLVTKFECTIQPPRGMVSLLKTS